MVNLCTSKLSKLNTNSSRWLFNLCEFRMLFNYGNFMYKLFLAKMFSWLLVSVFRPLRDQSQAGGKVSWRQCLGRKNAFSLFFSVHKYTWCWVLTYSSSLELYLRFISLKKNIYNWMSTKVKFVSTFVKEKKEVPVLRSQQKPKAEIKYATFNIFIQI